MLVSWVFDKSNAVLVQTLNSTLLCHLWLRNFSWEMSQLSIAVWQARWNNISILQPGFLFSSETKTFTTVLDLETLFTCFLSQHICKFILSVSLHWRLVQSGSEWYGAAQSYNFFGTLEEHPVMFWCLSFKINHSCISIKACFILLLQPWWFSTAFESVTSVDIDSKALSIAFPLNWPTDFWNINTYIDCWHENEPTLW